MNPAQKQYCTTRRKLLAVISALQHFRHYLIGNKVILRTDHYSLIWLKTFKIPEGIMARWIETLAEFDIEIEHGPGLVHSNVDGVSRPFCKQCEGKVPKTRWIDELERADELTEPLSVNRIIFLPEITDDQVKELQAEDADLGPIIEWMKDGHKPTPDYLKSKSLDTQTLWAQVPTIHLLDGILVHKLSDESMIQLVVPSVLRRRLFELTHAGPLAAHLGPQQTLQQLRALYYWQTWTEMFSYGTDSAKFVHRQKVHHLVTKQDFERSSQEPRWTQSLLTSYPDSLLQMIVYAIS